MAQVFQPAVEPQLILGLGTAGIQRALLLLKMGAAAAAAHEGHAAAVAAWRRYMTLGAFERAWLVSDELLRLRSESPCARTPREDQSVWNGTELEQKRVLIRCYRGFGDTIQFIRYAPAIRRVASRVIVCCQEALIPLLRNVDGIDELLPVHEGEIEIDVDYDVDVEVMELPFIFRTTLNDIPSSVPYIRVPPPHRKRSGGYGPPDVGLVWKAGDWTPDRFSRRSLSFSRLAPLLRVPVAWYILQAGPGLLERPPWFGRLGEVNEPVSTAHEMLHLDLVISVDSMPAHLAGALGIPVWTLLPADADWRWMRNRDDSPWYPTMRLFRQPRPGDWDSVVRKVAETLSAAASFGLACCRYAYPSFAYIKVG